MTKKNRKKNAMRSLSCWWRKRRNYYVNMQQDDSSGEKVQDITMEDVDSDREKTPVRGKKPHDGGTSARSTPVFDVSSMHSLSLITPMATRHLVIQPSPLSPKVIHESVSSSKMFKDVVPNTSQATPSLLLTQPVAIAQRSLSSGSLESMDSLVESYWDPDDADDETSSQITPIATNGHLTAPDFFTEHVHFLRVQTRPRKVEVVWSPTS
jgi:hypothetical protein